MTITSRFYSVQIENILNKSITWFIFMLSSIDITLQMQQIPFIKQDVHIALEHYYNNYQQFNRHDFRWQFLYSR